MKKRCLNPADLQFKHYGGRGITVCDRWLSFENFAADMGPRPSPKHSLDRINNDGNYEPSNCRWATVEQQVYNKRNNRFIDYEGVRYTRREFAAAFGVPYVRVAERHRRGTPPELIAKHGSIFKDRHRPPDWILARMAATHCVHGHELTPDNIYLTRKGQRVCKVCQNAANKASALKRKHRQL